MKKIPSVDLENARMPDQQTAMEGIITRKECPFCPGNLPPEHKEPILRDCKHWFVTKNQWTHKNAKINLLFILKKHAESLKDLEPAAGAELFELLSWAEEEFDFPGGAIGMRFGDTDFSGASVRHIHAQLFAPDRDNNVCEPVRFKIGKSEK